jgi:hypothetical protein
MTRVTERIAKAVALTRGAARLTHIRRGRRLFFLLLRHQYVAPVQLDGALADTFYE